MARRNSAQTIQELLDAAKAIISEQGVARLTLDAVVRRAGLSKGAIQHHFKAKTDLVVRLTEDAIEEFNAEVAAARGEDRTPGSYVRAYMDVTFRVAAEMAQSGALSLMGELARDPEGRDVFTQAMAQWSAAIEGDGIDPCHAQMLRMTADGLLLYDSSGYPLDPGIRDEMIRRLNAMAQDSEPILKLLRK